MKKNVEEMFKKCSTDQSCIRKRNTTYKIGTLASRVDFCFVLFITWKFASRVENCWEIVKRVCSLNRYLRLLRKQWRIYVYHLSLIQVKIPLRTPLASLPPANLTRIDFSRNLVNSRILSFFLFSCWSGLASLFGLLAPDILTRNCSGLQLLCSNLNNYSLLAKE